MRKVHEIGDGPGDETVTLDYAARHVRRKVLTTDAGSEILVDLAEIASLKHGDALLCDDGSRVRVCAAAERLTEARGAGLARLAWHIGNRHTPCQVEADRLLIRHDHVLEDMLRRLGADLCTVEESFEPEGGAYGHGRTHGHSHGHGAQDDPNAHIPNRHE